MHDRSGDRVDADRRGRGRRVEPRALQLRTPSAMPPVPAGVMLDANDDATRDRTAGANGTGSATEPTNDTAANKYVSAEPRAGGSIHLPVGVLEGVPRVADVRELRQQEVERGGQRDDRQQRARPHPFQPFERHLGRPRSSLHVLTQVLERDLTRRRPPPHRAGQRQRLQQRQGGRDPSDAESVDRGVDRGVDADEQRGLDEQLRDVPRPLARCRGQLGVVEVDEVGLVEASTITFSSARLRCAMRRVVEHTDLGPQLVEEGAVDARRIDLVMRSPTTSSVTIIAEPSGVAPMPTRRGVVRPLSAARWRASASCSIRRCTVG